MRILRAVLLVPVLLALIAGGAFAKTAPTKPAGLDKSFGSKGVLKIATGGLYAEQAMQMDLGPKGRIYVLQGNLLLAFEANGEPAHDFGGNGRVRVRSPRGELKPAGLAVDSQGRIVVSGTITTYPFTSDPPIPANTKVFDQTTEREAFVNRYLEDGSSDIAFGNAGEVDTTFGLPRPTGEPGKGIEFEHALVEATTLAVDPQDRPTIGGDYVNAIYYCAYGDELFTSFAGRLTASGAPDLSYAGKGYVTGADGSVEALAKTPEGGVATLSLGEPHCAEHASRGPSTFDVLTENGDRSPLFDPVRAAPYAGSPFAIDPKGRFLSISSRKLIRLRPNGALDTSFGFGGGIPLKGGVTSPGAIAVDARNRTLVVDSTIEHPYGPRLVRYTAAGKRDWKFGHKGLLEGPIVNDTRGGVQALAIDGKGRIYAAGWIESKTLKTGHGIQITRFLPGS